MDTSSAETEPLPVVTPTANTSTATSVEEMPTNKCTYYDVMMVDEEDIISISHDEIISNKCDVTLDKLSEQDIADIQQYMQGKQKPREIEKTIKLPRHLKEYKRKTSHRPRRKPSKERIRAQQIIHERNVKIIRQELKPTPLRIDPLPDTSKPNSDSDATISYSPPRKRPKTDVKKSTTKKIAKFVIRTVGIKMFKDKDIEQAKSAACKCAFRCFLCGSKFATAKELNTHFCNTHDELICQDCGKGFTSPLSLAKHRYVYKACTHSCGYCERKFPFKSQKDLHETIHTNTERHKCTVKDCTSSFGCESDLKLHMVVHKTPPIKCDFCEYTNKDIRNVRQHSRVHSDVKPYKCERCPKRFKFVMQHKRHMVTSHSLG